jgi:hypothetical protein
MVSPFAVSALSEAFTKDPTPELSEPLPDINVLSHALYEPFSGVECNEPAPVLQHVGLPLLMLRMVTLRNKTVSSKVHKRKQSCVAVLRTRKTFDNPDLVEKGMAGDRFLVESFEALSYFGWDRECYLPRKELKNAISKMDYEDIPPRVVAEIARAASILGGNELESPRSEDRTYPDVPDFEDWLTKACVHHLHKMSMNEMADCAFFFAANQFTRVKHRKFQKLVKPIENHVLIAVAGVFDKYARYFSADGIVRTLLSLSLTGMLNQRTWNVAMDEILNNRPIWMFETSHIYDLLWLLGDSPYGYPKALRDNLMFELRLPSRRVSIGLLLRALLTCETIGYLPSKLMAHVYSELAIICRSNDINLVIDSLVIFFRICAGPLQAGIDPQDLAFLVRRIRYVLDWEMTSLEDRHALNVGIERPTSIQTDFQRPPKKTSLLWTELNKWLMDDYIDPLGRQLVNRRSKQEFKKFEIAELIDHPSLRSGWKSPKRNSVVNPKSLCNLLIVCSLRGFYDVPLFMKSLDFLSDRLAEVPLPKLRDMVSACSFCPEIPRETLVRFSDYIDTRTAYNEALDAGQILPVEEPALAVGAPDLGSEFTPEFGTQVEDEEELEAEDATSELPEGAGQNKQVLADDPEIDLEAELLDETELVEEEEEEESDEGPGTEGKGF